VKIIGLLIAGFIWPLASQAASFSGENLSGTTVAKVRAFQSNGTVTLGSAVLLGGERLVTNCHVTAAAQSVQIIHNGRSWQAEAEAGDSIHDLCILRAAGISGAAAVAAASLTVGQKVFAAGFPGGNQFWVTTGRIVALHDYDGAKIIQVSSPFDHGASGGGLFDEDGRLIGILTFKARAGGEFHFALPIAWAKNLDRQEPGHSAEGNLAFWQQAYEKQPYFLRAVSLEASQKWDALAALAEQWTKDSPMNTTAWTALGTAFRHLQRPDEARLAFREAKLLEPPQEPQQTRHEGSLTYISTEVTAIGHSVSGALPGFDSTGIEMPGHATK
jgi:serine protease Do